MSGFFRKAQQVADEHFGNNQQQLDQANGEKTADEPSAEELPMNLTQLMQVQYKSETISLAGDSGSESTAAAKQSPMASAKGDTTALYHRVHRMYYESFENVFGQIEDEFDGIALLKVQCRVKGHSWKLWHRQVLKIPLRQIQQTAEELRRGREADFVRVRSDEIRSVLDNMVTARAPVADMIAIILAPSSLLSDKPSVYCSIAASAVSELIRLLDEQDPDGHSLDGNRELSRTEIQDDLQNALAHFSRDADSVADEWEMCCDSGCSALARLAAKLQPDKAYQTGSPRDARISLSSTDSAAMEDTAVELRPHISVLSKDDEAEEVLRIPVYAYRHKIALGSRTTLKVTDLEDVDEDIFGDDVEKRELSRVHKIKLAPLQDGTTLELQRMEDDISGWIQLLQFLARLAWEKLDERISNSRALAAAALHRGEALSNSTSLSFTVPPTSVHGILADGSGFHVRMRTGLSSSVIGTKYEWEDYVNPLQWNGGYNFEPQYNPARTDKKGVPPPVVLDPMWEQKFVMNSPLPQAAGDLRVFKITGLQPTCDTISAKSFGFGLSRVEVQVASCHDSHGQAMSWSDANDSDDTAWSEPLVYDLPAEPLSSVLLTVGSNWVRSRGLPAIEDALIGQMDRHKKKNLKIIKTFAEDIVEKLQPIYAYKVEPWLSQHATLRLLVQDTRAATLRAGCRWVLDQCSIALPLPMARDRPKFSRVRILLDDGTVIKEMQLESEHDGGGPEMIADPQNMRVRGNTRVTLPPGQSFVVQAWIRRFAEYHPLASKTDSAPRKVQLWGQVTQSNEPLDLQEADILLDTPTSTAHGGRVRMEIPCSTTDTPNDEVATECGASTCNDDDLPDGVLRFAGSDGEGFPLLTDGLQFVLRIEAFEDQAHESSTYDLDLRVVDEKSTAAAASTSANTDSHNGKENWPPLEYGKAPSLGRMIELIPKALEEMTVDYRNRALETIGMDPGLLGTSLRDTPSPSEIVAAAESAAFAKIVAAGARRLPKVWTTETVASWSQRQIARKVEQDDGIGDAAFDVLDDVVKVKMVEYWQKSLESHAKAMSAGPVEQARNKAHKLAEFEAIFESDAQAVEKHVAINPERLQAVDMIDCGALLLKRLLKNEWKELVHEDVGPILIKVGLAAVMLIILNFMATWWAVRAASYMYHAGSDHPDVSALAEAVSAQQLQLDTQASMLQELLTLIKKQQSCEVPMQTGLEP